MAKQKTASRKITICCWLWLAYADSGLDEEQLNMLLNWMSAPIDGVRVMVHDQRTKAIMLAVEPGDFDVVRVQVKASVREFVTTMIPGRIDVAFIDEM